MTRGVDRELAVSPTDVGARFTALYVEYRSVILGVARRRLRDPAAAEDVTAEVFRAAWTHRDQADTVFQLAWLYGTLRNQIGNEYRRRDRAGRLRERLLMHQPTATADQSRDDTLAIRQAVSKLATHDQELIALVFWDDLTREEAAQLLGCSVNAINLHLQRARRKLAAHLTDDKVPR